MKLCKRILAAFIAMMMICSIAMAGSLGSADQAEKKCTFGQHDDLMKLGVKCPICGEDPAAKPEQPDEEVAPTKAPVFQTAPAPEHKHVWESLKEGEWFCLECGKFTTTNPNPFVTAPAPVHNHKWTSLVEGEWFCVECGKFTLVNPFEGDADVAPTKAPVFVTAPAPGHNHKWTSLVEGEWFCVECGKFTLVNPFDGDADVAPTKAPVFQTVPPTHNHKWTSLVEGEWFCVECGKFTLVNPFDGDADVAPTKAPVFVTAPAPVHNHKWTSLVEGEWFCVECGKFTLVNPFDGDADVAPTKAPVFQTVPPKHEHKWTSLVEGEWFCVECGKFTLVNPFECEHKDTHFKQIIVDPTCTEAGYILQGQNYCDECEKFIGLSQIFTVGLEARGHEWVKGVCAVCGEKSPFEVAPEKECEHKNAHFKQIIVDPTCTEAGYILQGQKYCDECEKFIGLSQIFTVGLEARGHKWADGVCTVCGFKSPFEVAPSHKCMAETKLVHNKDGKHHDVVCAECGKVWKSEAHNWESLVEGEWFCVDCGKFEYREVVKTKMYYNNTMTGFGPTTKELVGGNDWYRVTPVDLAVDGVYTYDLVASNKYIVGTVTITVNAGALTVDYKTMSDVNVKDEALLVYASKADLAEGKAVTANVGAAINTAETFGEDTKVLVSLILTGDYDAMGKDLINADAAAAMIANID